MRKVLLLLAGAFVVLLSWKLFLSGGGLQKNILSYTTAEFTGSLEQKMQDTGADILRGQFQTEYHHAGPSQTENIKLAASMIRGLEVRPGEIFSFNKVVGPYTAERGFAPGDVIINQRVHQGHGGGVCQVAGTLNNAVLLAGMKVLERHNHSMSISYIPPGQDAAVSGYGGKDFKFRNITEDTVFIWTTAEQGILTVSIYGKNEGPYITIHHKILSTTPFEKIRENDPTLPQGVEQVVRQGIVGRRIKYWLEIVTDRGIEKRDLGVDNYRPSPKIVKVGTKQ